MNTGKGRFVMSRTKNDGTNLVVFIIEMIGLVLIFFGLECDTLKQFGVYLGVSAFVFMPFNIKGTIVTIGGSGIGENIISFFSIRQYVEKNAFSIFSIRQEAGGNAYALISLSQEAGRNTYALISLSQKAGGNAYSLISLIQRTQGKAYSLFSIYQRACDDAFSILVFVQVSLLLDAFSVITIGYQRAGEESGGLLIIGYQCSGKESGSVIVFGFQKGLDYAWTFFGLLFSQKSDRKARSTITITFKQSVRSTTRYFPLFCKLEEPVESEEEKE